MFTIKSTDKSKSFKLQTYKPGQRIPVFPAVSLLADKRHQFFLQRVSDLSGLSSEHYDVFYRSLIDRFVEFVQVLPTETDNPLCSLMNEGLVRGVNALHRLTTEHSDATALEKYAMFSAALLKDVANVVVNQKIFITDKEGAFIKEWLPFEGSLEADEEAEYYKIMPLAPTYRRITHSITPVLARQLLSEKGFLWIASDARVFADWLDALRDDDSEGAGRLANTLQLMKGNPEVLLDSLPAVKVPLEESPATTHADTFFTWLKSGIANGQIKVNTADAGVHVTPEGVFIEKGGVFKHYVDLYVDLPVNMFSVYQQFGNLFGLTKLSGIDYRIDQLFSEYPEFSQGKLKAGFASPLSARANQIREGVIIAEPALIFTKGEVPSPTPYLKSLPASQRPQNIPNITPDSKPKQTPK